jgi:hypothetical protein
MLTKMLTTTLGGVSPENENPRFAGASEVGRTACCANRFESAAIEAPALAI